MRGLIALGESLTDPCYEFEVVVAGAAETQLGRLVRRLGVNFRRAGFEVRFWREGKLSSRIISITKEG